MMTLTPAYGRDYKTADAAKTSWYRGDDWIIADISSRWSGKPVNRSQLLESGEDVTVKLRYADLKKVCVA